MGGPTKKELQERVKELEKALQDVKLEKNWLCFSESPVPTYIADRTGTFIAYNTAMEELTGYSQEEIPDIETALEYVIPDAQYRHGLMEMILKTRKLKQNITRNKYYITRKNGEERYVEFSTFLIGDCGMRVVQGIDITDIKNAEMELLESNERHKSFVDNFQGIAFQIDLKKKTPVFLYGLVEEMTGYYADDFLSGDVLWESLVYKEDYAKVIIELERLVDIPARRTNIEFRYYTRDNEQRWVRVLANIARDRYNEPYYLYGTAFDITDFKKATEQAKIQQQQLIQADKMASLGILVSGVAHEINNPNHYILSNINMLNNIWQDIEPIIEKYYRESGDFTIGNMPYSEMNENIPLLISAISEGSERIKFIVKELRDYARQTTVEMNERVNVNAVVKSAIVLLSNMIEKSTHNFINNLDDSLPSIQGNYRRLEQVVINLIQNSCQALDDKREAIEVSTAYDAEHNHVMITIRDEGVGIPEKELQHVTDPFFTTKRESKGTGLGLSIALKIIQEHGGSLTFESKETKGTTAVIRIAPKNVRHDKHSGA